MNRRLSPYDLLCDPDHLLRAWRQVRRNRGAAGIDMVTLAEFERELLANLNALAAQLREGRYYPMPARRFEMQKPRGGTRKLAILAVEDRIVQRAALEAIEPAFEASFFPCSYGFRPGRNVEMAIQHVLRHRAAGDIYVVDADIADCFDSLDHDLLMELVSMRVRDKRMQGLIRMWLDCGQVLPPGSAAAGARPSAPGLAERLSQYAAGSVDAAVDHLLDEDSGGYGAFEAASQGYEGQGYEGEDDEDEANEIQPASAPEEPISDARRQARQEAVRRLGRDGLLLLLTSTTRARRWLTPATAALTGAAVLATVVYPRARKYLREKRAARVSGAGTLQGGSLSPLLANIYLHEFDRAMMRAGLHLVRYADDWVITCRDEASAHAALERAGRELHRLKLRLNLEKTRITRFDQGLDFLGYRFHPHLIAAARAPRDDQTPLALWWNQAKGKLRHAPARIPPAAAQLRGSLQTQAREGLAKLKRLANRFRKRTDDE